MIFFHQYVTDTTGERHWGQLKDSHICERTVVLSAVSWWPFQLKLPPLFPVFRARAALK